MSVRPVKRLAKARPTLEGAGERMPRSCSRSRRCARASGPAPRLNPLRELSVPPRGDLTLTSRRSAAFGHAQMAMA